MYAYILFIYFLVGRFLLAVLLVLPAAVLAKDYFTAAVFEHRPRGIDSEGKQEVIENLKYYEKAAAVAAKKVSRILKLMSILL